MHIALHDADDYWHPNHLEEFYKAIQKFPNAALYCNAYFLKLSANYTQKASYNISKMRLQKIKNYFENSMIHPLAMSSGVAFKKNEFEALGHYNPSIPSGQDLDLWIRFGLYKTIVFNPAFTSYYDKTVHASLSKGNFRENKYLLFHAYIEEEQKDPFLKKYLDLNRYSVALQCKYADDNFILKKLKKDIDIHSLNAKQKFLMRLPNPVVRILKKITRNSSAKKFT